MSTAVDNRATARILAACDLITEPLHQLEVGSIARDTAELLARLTSCELGIVAIDDNGEHTVGSYPRRIGKAASTALLERVMKTPGRVLDRLDLADLVDPQTDIRAVAIDTDGMHVGYIAAVGPVHEGFGAIDEWLLMVSAQRTRAQLETVALHRERLLDQQLVDDAQLAGELQQLMLSDHSPAPGLDIAGVLRPARQVGGDLYGWQSDALGTTIAVADVSGKGASAALLMASVQGSLRHALTSGETRPSAVLGMVRNDVAPLLDRTSRLVTMAVARFDLTGTFRIASAGHSPVVLRSGGRSELLLPGAPPLGAPVITQPEDMRVLGPNDLLLMGTDGLIDQQNPSGVAIGTDGLLAATERVAGEARDIVDTILDRLDAFAGGTAQDDDQALVAIRRQVDAR